MGKTWHPDHFVCTVCHKPLSGGKFNHRDNKPYCEDDFTKLFSEKCAKCNQPIKEKMIMAMGKYWHEEHFVCTKCGKPLVGQQFCEHEGAPYCQKDYHELYTARCAGCGKPITDMALVALDKQWHQSCFKCMPLTSRKSSFPSKLLNMAEQDVYLAVDGNVICNVCNEPINGTIITAMGKTWHPNHFICARCRKPLMGTKFNHKDDQPYCEDDYAELFLERCAKCDKPIKDILIKAMGKNWHQEHFVCATCGAELCGQVFCEQEGVPYCLKDYNALFAPRCYGCNEPITDTTLVALGKNWHQQCFKCMTCGMPITDVRFQVVNDQPICSRCNTQ